MTTRKVTAREKSEMSVLSAFYIASTLLLCAAPASAHGPIIIDEATKAAFSSYEKTLADERTPLTLDTGQRVENCNEYLKASTSREQTSSLHQKPEYSEYIVCDLVEKIADSSGFASSPKRNKPFGETLKHRLDLRSFKSSFGPRLTDKKSTFNELDLDHLNVRSHALVISSPEWHFEVRLNAIVDTNSNKKPDWLLTVADEAKGGTYRSYQVLLAKDVPGEGLIAVDEIVN